MQHNSRLVGRVIRVGRGWVDVDLGRTVRRMTTRPDQLIRVGSQIVVHRDGAVVAPAQERASTSRVR